MGIKSVKSIVRNFPKQGIIINLLLLAALVLLVIGVSAPLLTLEKMYFFENTVTLLSTVKGLFIQKEWFLFIVIAVYGYYKWRQEYKGYNDLNASLIS